MVKFLELGEIDYKWWLKVAAEFRTVLVWTGERVGLSAVSVEQWRRFMSNSAIFRGRNDSLNSQKKNA